MKWMWLSLFLVAALNAQDKQPAPPAKQAEKKDPPANIKIETRAGSGPRSYNVKISGTIEGVPENSVFTITVKPIINRYRRSDEDVYDEKDKPKQPGGGFMPAPPNPQDPKQGPNPTPAPGPGNTTQDKPVPQGPPRATLRTIEIVTEAFYKRPLHFKVVVNRSKFEYEVELGPFVYDYVVRFFIDDQIANLGKAGEDLTNFKRAGTFLVGDIKLLTQNILEDSDFLQKHTKDMKDSVDSLLAGSTKEGLKKLMGVYLAVAPREGKNTMSAAEAMLRAIAMEIQIGVRPKNPKHAPFATPLGLLAEEEGHPHEDPKNNTEVEDQIKKLKDSDFEFNRIHGDECYKVIDQLIQMTMRETAVNGLMILRPSLEKAVALVTEFNLADDARKKDKTYWAAQLKGIDTCVEAMATLDSHMKSRAIFADRYIELSSATKPDLLGMLAAAQALILAVKEGISSEKNFPEKFVEKANEQVLAKMDQLEKELRALRILTPLAPKK